uniref:Uncharacterized protein n=1 Tax=Anguilla anguilla TaxID=7936 RepID=A0A0E9UJB2_ANGAN
MLRSGLWGGQSIVLGTPAADLLSSVLRVIFFQENPFSPSQNVVQQVLSDLLKFICIYQHS